MRRGTRVPDEVHLGVGEGALLGDLGGAQLVAAVDDVHGVGELGQEQALLDGRVAAADDGHRPAACRAAPSQVAHQLTPRPMNSASPGMPELARLDARAPGAGRGRARPPGR